MQISASDYAAFDKAVSASAEAATREMQQFLETLDFGDTYESKKAARNKVIEFMQSLVAKYGDASAAVAADFYNDIAEKAGVAVGDALLADSVADDAIAGSVRYSARKLFGQEASTELFKAAVLASVGRYVKKQANDTMSKNAVRDGNKGVVFARVPAGKETCAFCIMLASRGFVYATAKTAGEFDHFHDNCDCRIVAGFGDMSIAGYDPDIYYQKYKAARDAAKSGAWEDWKSLSPEEQAEHKSVSKSGKHKSDFNDFVMKRVTNELRRQNSDINK